MKQFVVKVLKMRKHLVRNNLSKKNAARVLKSLKKFELYLDFYPNVSDESIKKYCIKHIDDLLFLMPGKGSSSFQKLNQELNQFIPL